MIKVDLVYNYGFKWHNKEGIFVKGYLFDTSNRLYTGEKLIQYFYCVSNYSDFKRMVSEANGMFSVIINREGKFFAGVDIIRTFPLFYFVVDGGLHISDSSNFLAQTYQKKVNELATREFIATGFVTGSSTLFTGIKQIQPGQVVQFQNSQIKNKFYYLYVTQKVFSDDYTTLKTKLYSIIDRTVERMVSSISDSPVLLPLSGGYDSRLIAAALKLKGVEDVTCFTFGKKGLKDTEISKWVAEKLGYKWFFIEYTDDFINGYFDNQIFKKYYPYAANGSSFFYMQEYFAMLLLKNKIKIPGNAVFIPGHSGDFLGGSQLTKFNLSQHYPLKQVVDIIYKLKYSYILPGLNYKKVFKTKIKDDIKSFFTDETKSFAYSIIENWDYKEKLAKTITNSANVFSYFGYQYRLPFWDTELVNFFKMLPYTYKMNKKLYNEVLKEAYFSKLDINFKDELQPSQIEIRKQLFKNSLKPWLPKFIKIRTTRRQDWANYHAVTRPMIRQMTESGLKFKAFDIPYNAVIMQWYVSQLEK